MYKCRRLYDEDKAAGDDCGQMFCVVYMWGHGICPY